MKHRKLSGQVPRTYPSADVHNGAEDTSAAESGSEDPSNSGLPVETPTSPAPPTDANVGDVWIGEDVPPPEGVLTSPQEVDVGESEIPPSADTGFTPGLSDAIASDSVFAVEGDHNDPSYAADPIYLAWLRQVRGGAEAIRIRGIALSKPITSDGRRRVKTRFIAWIDVKHYGPTVDECLRSWVKLLSGLGVCIDHSRHGRQLVVTVALFGDDGPAAIIAHLAPG